MIAVLLGTVLIVTTVLGQDAVDLELVERAGDIHERVFTIDSHVDTPTRMVRGGFDIAQRHSYAKDGSQVDIPRLREGQLDAAFFVVFLPQGELESQGYKLAREKADLLFDAIASLTIHHSDDFLSSVTSRDASLAQSAGKIAAFVGIENAYPLGDEIELLSEYYRRGARYIGLTHFANNQIADSSTDPSGPMWNGVSPFGMEVIAEANRLGMLVDVSHASDAAFWDVMEASRSPVIASHSGVYSVYPHPRNMKDDMLIALAKNGGVVQINGYSAYLRSLSQDPRRTNALATLRDQYGAWRNLPASQRVEPERISQEINMRYPQKLAYLSDLLDHIDYAVDLVGIDHVGISMDFDGGGGVDGLSEVSDMQNLTVELVRRGYSEEDIGKFWGLNLLRVLDQVQATQVVSGTE